MDKKQLGNSDLQLTPIGFGAWAIGGGDWAFAWGPQDDNDSIAAIHKALDLGINLIDTAPIYGQGRSEKIVGEALRQAGRMDDGEEGRRHFFQRAGEYPRRDRIVFDQQDPQPRRQHSHLAGSPGDSVPAGIGAGRNLQRPRA